MLSRGVAAGSTLGSVVVGLVLLGGHFFRSNPVANSPQGSNSRVPAAQNQRASNQLQAKSRPQSIEGPWKASQEHFAGLGNSNCPIRTSIRPRKDIASLGDVTLQLSGDQRGRSALGSSRDLWCIPKGEHVAAMIAIVSDPVQSRMRLQFDRTVEAIQLAAESSNYVIDRYWLPWNSRSKMGPDGFPEASVPDDPEKQNEPGLLMFRWDGAASQTQPTTLYVFLVGDVATAGIHGAQFNHAVDDVLDLCNTNDRSKCRQVWIMGPTSSGSLSSLRRLAEARTPLQFVAYSGTVSSICAVQKQGFSPPSNECPVPPLVPISKSNVEFHSLVFSTEPAVQSLINYLKPGCGLHPDIAILSEASTTYGHTPRDLPRGNNQLIQNPADPCYVTFSYPREISSLRNAYKDSGSSPTQADNNNGSSYLPFNLADQEGNSSDEPPDFSTQQGPLSKEAVLLSFAAELRRNNFKYIGIEGSNVLDVLFLAGFLRKACPDVRLFVLNSDLLFERDPDNAVFIGTLALTTYPLIPDNLEWTNGQTRPQPGQKPAVQLSSRLPFADQYEEAQYNAALLAIQGLVPEVPRLNPYEFRVPFRSSPERFNPRCTVLPLWLTAVGNGGYWPVQIMPASLASIEKPECATGQAGSEVRSAPPVELKNAAFPPAWKALLTILSALALFHFVLLVTASPLRSRFRDFSLIRAAPGQRFFFLNVATASLVAALLMLLAPLWRFGHTEYYLTGLKFFVPVVAAALFLTCLALYPRFLWVAHRQHGFDESTSPLQILLLTLAYIGVWAVTIVGIDFWWRLFRDDASHYGFFFAYRSVHLATGISPFMPIIPLLAAIYCWGMLEVWRLRFHNQLRPRLETKGVYPGESTERKIAESINLNFLRGTYLTALLVVFAVWLFFLRPEHPFDIFEHASFGIIYEVLFCLVVLLMLTAGFRLSHIWSELKKLLAELDQSRVRLAFSHLKEYRWSPIWQAGVQEIEWTNITRSLEVLQQIKSLEPKPVGDFKRGIEKFEDQIQGFRHSRAELKKYGGWHRFHGLNISFFKIQKQLATLLQPALAALESHWNTESFSQEEEADPDSEKQPVVVYCEPETPDPNAQRLHRLQQFVALRYVAFIRGILAQIRRLIILITILFSLVLISLNIYSFEPHQSLIWSFTALFAVIGLLVIVVLMQVHRDHILSRVTGTKPNELGLDFYLRVITFGAAPLLTLLATHFPSVGHFLLSLFQPGLEALK